MKELKDFEILDILNYITPETNWKGDLSSERNGKSLKNLEVLNNMFLYLSAELECDLDIGLRHPESTSAKNISQKKYEMVTSLYNYFANLKANFDRNKENNTKTANKNGGTKE